MAVLLMMFSVVVWSLFPLISAWCIDYVSTFDYIFWMFLINFFTSLFLLRTVPTARAAKLPKVLSLPGMVKFEIMIGCLTIILSIACLLSSFFYMSKAGATIIYEVWPIVAMYATPLLIKKGWDKISARDMFFSVLAFGGVGFIYYPEIMNEGGFFLDGFALKELYILLLPFLGGVFMAISSVMKARISHNLECEGNPLASVLFVKMLFSLVVSLLCIPFLLFWPDAPSTYTLLTVLGMLFTGVMTWTFGDVAYTLAVLKANKSSIMVLWFLVPILSVVWLWVAGESAITAFIVLGAIIIISSNLLMTVKADSSMSYMAAVVTMIFCGIYTYFTDGLNFPDYYEAVGVPVVFFAILVAFMMDRLIKRDALEEELALDVINFINTHSKKFGKKGQEFCEHVAAIVRTNNPTEVNDHYRAVRNSGVKHLEAVHTQLDRLALSKVQGSRFAELFILFLIGALTVGVSIVYRPDDIIGDGFAMVHAVTIVFIFFTVMDLAHERKCFNLERIGDSRDNLTLAERVTRDRLSESVISAGLIVLVMTAFVCLFYTKHATMETMGHKQQQSQAAESRGMHVVAPAPDPIFE